MNHADRRYRPDVDGLRALAVVAVLFFHAFPARLPGGFVGVDVFFRDLRRSHYGERDLDSMVVDYGHPSPKGSSYLGRAFWKPYLDRVMR